MSAEQVLSALTSVCALPEGSVNVRVGKAVEGPGGRWVPCASAVGGGAYLPCIFEVGPGRRQVSGATAPVSCADEAYLRAIELAQTAAA